MNLQEKLNKIQTTIVAPKGQVNKFGNYNYRSTEDILAALKPLLDFTKTTIKLTDEIVMIGTRYYVKATATLKDVETGESESSSANAREEEVKKGMDASQITGSASSYARKMALSGLLGLDDVKDADDQNKHGKTNAQANEVILITPEQVGKISKALTNDELRAYVSYYQEKDPNIKSIADLTEKQAKAIMTKRGIQ